MIRKSTKATLKPVMLKSSIDIINDGALSGPIIEASAFRVFSFVRFSGMTAFRVFTFVKPTP